MAQAANTFDDDQPVERQPGQLRRNKQGTPYVADPTGALIKPKRKADPPQVKMLAYGRPSGFGKQVEDSFNLAKWAERQVALGLGLDYAEACAAMASPALASACAALAQLDKETKEFREAADAIVVEAKRIAKSGLAAERGTHAHALAEDDDEGRDWVIRAEAGQVLDMDVDAQRHLIDAWRSMLDRNGLEILASEYIVVHDGYRMAGTADRVARLTRPLRFSLVTGEIVDLAAGTVLVLDIKSGKHRTDNRGVAMYWQAYAVQIATYAGGVLYDPDTDVRTPYPWPVDQRWGLIAHLDVLGAIAGQPACELILVDLEAGRYAAELCLAAKAWEKRKDVFSISQISDEPISSESPPAVSQPATAEGNIAEASPRASDDTTGPAGPLQPAGPVAIPPTGVGQRRPAATSIVHRQHPDIDEGTVDHPDGLDVAFASLAHHFRDLDERAREWIGVMQARATVTGCSFKASEQHTLRRFELLRGLIALAAHGDIDDDLIRVIAHHVTGDTGTLAALAGTCVGCLDHTQATRFAETCDRLVAGLDQVVIDNDGIPHLRPNRTHLASLTAA